MIGISVNDIFLKLPSDFKIRFSLNNPLFGNDIIPGEYSLPVSFDLEPNREALGFPDKIEIREKQKEFPCKVFYRGNYLKEGTLRIKATGKSCSGYILLGVSEFNSKIKGRNLKDVNYGADVEVTGSTYQYVIIYHITNPEHVLKINSTEFTFIKGGGESTDAYHIRIKDSINAHSGVNTQVIASIFSESGNTYVKIQKILVGAVTPVTFVIDSSMWGFHGSISANTIASIDLKDHMNGLLTEDYKTLKYIFFPVYSPDFFYKRPDYRPVLNYYNTATGSFVTNTEDDDYYSIVPYVFLRYVLECIFTEAGYTLEGDFIEDDDIKRIVLYNNVSLDRISVDPYDQFNGWNPVIDISAHLPDMSITDFLIHLKNIFGLLFTFKGTVCTISTAKEIFKKTANKDWSTKQSYIGGSEFKHDDGFKLYFKGTSDKILMDEYKSGNGEVEISSDIAITSSMVISPLWLGSPEASKVPHVNDVGTSSEYDLGENDFSPRLISYFGMQPSELSNDYPFASNDNTNYSGTIVGPYSLKWIGTYGLYNKFWSTLARLRANQETIKAFFSIASNDIQLNEWSDIIFSNHQNYVIKTIDVSLPFKLNEPTEIEVHKL